MEKYIVIKELPDAHVGTEVIWDEENNVFYYQKSGWVSPHPKNHLTPGQVTQTPEYFCRANEYPEYYAYHHPVYSRKEILDLVKECFCDTSTTRKFEKRLREIGKSNAEKMTNRHNLL